MSDTLEPPGCKEHGTIWCTGCKDFCYCPGECHNLDEEEQEKWLRIEWLESITVKTPLTEEEIKRGQEIAQELGLERQDED